MGTNEYDLPRSAGDTDPRVRTSSDHSRSNSLESGVSSENDTDVDAAQRDRVVADSDYCRNERRFTRDRAPARRRERTLTPGVDTLPITEPIDDLVAMRKVRPGEDGRWKSLSPAGESLGSSVARS